MPILMSSTKELIYTDNSCSSSMAPCTILTTVFLCFFSTHAFLAESSFDQYYSVLWGNNHVSVSPQGSQVDLLMDQSSGGGFRSKLDYGSGLFHIRMKIPEKITGGIVTCFYLTSAPDNQAPGNHYEIDFEFLGTNGTVQTNVYNNDEGHREQSFNLWFNPSQDFHSYEFLWNTHQIVFLVDRIPIRVFKNNLAHGIDYPNKAMHIEASIWNADWAGVVDWSQAPFIAHYQDFNFGACPATGSIAGCDSGKYFWNKKSYWELVDAQKKQMEEYRRMFMTYDYCSKPSTRLPECEFNN